MEGILVATLNPYRRSVEHEETSTTGECEDVELDLSVIESYAQYLSGEGGCSGVFVCGSTGDFSLLSLEERLQIQGAWLKPEVRNLFQHVIIHIGSPVFSHMIQLGKHASQNGATALCVTFPAFSGHAPKTEQQLVEYLSQISGQLPDTPLLLYNVEGSTPAPYLQGLYPVLSSEDFRKRVPTFTGLKFTYPNLIDAVDVKTRLPHLDVAFGCDELALSAMAVGFTSFIGSTYNLFGSTFKSLQQLYSSGQVEQAQDLYSKLFSAIRYLNSKGNFLMNLRVLTNDITTKKGFTLGNFSKSSFMTSKDLECSLDIRYFKETYGDLLNKV